MSVLINGSPSIEFNLNRGLRQGNPLSPLLFNIVAELLNLLLRKEEQIGLIKGINLGSGPTITHEQYADDTIIFVENSSHSCRGIKIVLTLFEVLSGLTINYRKSSLFTSRADQSKAGAWANILGCEVGNCPLAYLGANLGCSPKNISSGSQW